MEKFGSSLTFLHRGTKKFPTEMSLIWMYIVHNVLIVIRLAFIWQHIVHYAPSASHHQNIADSSQTGTVYQYSGSSHHEKVIAGQYFLMRNIISTAPVLQGGIVQWLLSSRQSDYCGGVGECLPSLYSVYTNAMQTHICQKYLQGLKFIVMAAKFLNTLRIWRFKIKLLT